MSVVIPAYESHTTLPGCLDALAAQSFTDFEVVIVDSSPRDRVSAMVSSAFPGSRLIRSNSRLTPQAARSLGVRHARGRVLVFTDPDIYVPKDWLTRLLAVHREGHDLVLGSIACHGSRWIDLGTHFAKFGVCLPGGPARAVRLGWSGNLLVERRLYEALGGWDTNFVQGDCVFTARAAELGRAAWFDPGVPVFHDHDGVGLLGALRERFQRGREFATLVASGRLGEVVDRRKLRPGRAVLLPVRVALQLLRVGTAAARAGMLRDLLVSAPITVLGIAAWYGGEAAAAFGGAGRGVRGTSSGPCIDSG